MSLGIYLHVPFCRAKCHYCDFISYPMQQEQVSAYLQALALEAKYYGGTSFGRQPVDTIFIGGGTPTCLSTENICHIIQIVREYFIWDRDCEVTIEANPGTVNIEKLSGLREQGVNRISFGVQAFNDELLAQLGRIHRVADAKTAVHQARACGFENINLDLMFALPGQSMTQWQNTLAEAVALAPEHLSCYSLKIEPGTPFGEQYQAGLLPPFPEDLELAMYLRTIEYLASQGYPQYEISNFARPDRQCRHNLRYWESSEYLGLGPAAHSYQKGQRWYNLAKIPAYVQQVAQLGHGQAEIESIDAATARAEFMIMGLRLVRGVNLDQFYEQFGLKLLEVYGLEVETLINMGMMAIENDWLKLTAKAFPVANLVLEKFV